MRERGWGRIVNVGSTTTLEPIDGLALSNVYRAAAVGLFKTLATEVAGDGVTLNTVATGRSRPTGSPTRAARSSMRRSAPRTSSPPGRLGDPDEYGDLVAFICSERAPT